MKFFKGKKFGQVPIYGTWTGEKPVKDTQELIQPQAQTNDMTNTQANTQANTQINVQIDSQINSQATFQTTPQTINTEESLFPKFFYKPLKKETLTIILLENTSSVNEEAKVVEKIVEKLSANGLVCIISYSDTVSVSDIVNASKATNIPVFDGKTGEKACLFDALIELENLVRLNYSKRQEDDTSTSILLIDKVEVIGIGNCIDNCSKASKDESFEKFYALVKIFQVSTKYFCLTEDSFIRAAEIGFHTIGAISKSYN